MSLLRTILVFVIIVILVHLGIAYFGVDPNQNGLTRGVVGLAQLLEIPARALLQVLPLSAEQRQNLDSGGVYSIGLVAVAFYFVLYLLLGVGRR